MAIPIAARRKVMQAASTVAPDTMREAAILGGVVRCMVEHGHLIPAVVRVWTMEVLGYYKLSGVDRRPPCNAELAQVVGRFEDAFGRRVA
jgi:hypothetical protein